ncbi:hypothetical protein BHM03_00014381 [Ensete ventricosum]|nr:hypothetical protein BHM03_00014381 [Ensete ventricosum]
MPCLNISTNVSLESVDPSAVLSETTKAVAKIIGKPESVCGHLPSPFFIRFLFPFPACLPSCLLRPRRFRLWMEWFYVLNLEL